MARLLGLTLLWQNEAGSSEPPPEGCVFYTYLHGDPRRRDLHLYLLVLGRFLRRQRVAHNASDVLLFTLDFLVPLEFGDTAPEVMVERQRHCPEDVIRQVLAARRVP